MMKVNIWQLKKLHCRESFMSYSWMHREGYEPHRGMYDLAWSGELPANHLDGVYGMLNVPTLKPDDYHGHSLSVSDVVEVLEGTEISPAGVYYVDTIGFKWLEGWDNDAEN